MDGRACASEAGIGFLSASVGEIRVTGLSGHASHRVLRSRNIRCLIGTTRSQRRRLWAKRTRWIVVAVGNSGKYFAGWSYEQPSTKYDPQYFKYPGSKVHISNQVTSFAGHPVKTWSASVYEPVSTRRGSISPEPASRYLDMGDSGKLAMSSWSQSTWL